VQAFCTSIVAETESGVILHARNLDYSLAPVLRNLTIEVDFRQNNNVSCTLRDS
jgi:penicillin V acylase-like amidase (Ntn superfamily)